MRENAIHAAIGFVILMFLILSKTTIRYHVTARWLRISWLGLPVRWVRLKNIRQILSQRVFWAERWANTLSPTNRYLLIRKYSGLFKNLVITPRNHMVFKAELERRRSQLLSSPAPAGTSGPPGSDPSQRAVTGPAAN